MFPLHLGKLRNIARSVQPQQRILKYQRIVGMECTVTGTLRGRISIEQTAVFCIGDFQEPSIPFLNVQKRLLARFVRSTVYALPKQKKSIASRNELRRMCLRNSEDTHDKNREEMFHGKMVSEKR